MYGVLATGAIAAAASAVAATADFLLSEYALPTGNAANFAISPVVGVQRVGTTRSGGGGTSTSRMWTHVTLGGESPALTIALFYGDVRFEVSSITVDGADVSGWLALSALHATAPYGAVVYVVPGLEAGEHTISVTYAGAAENWYVSEETQNVHQTRPVRDADYNASTTDGSAQTPTITLDSSDADLMQIFGVRNSGSLIVPSDQTSRYEDSASDGKYFSDKVGSTPSVTGGYEISTGLGAASSYAFGAISLRPPTPFLTTVTVSVMPDGGGDYISLAAAIAGEARDLVAVNEICRIECHAGTDSTPVTVTGFTTDATHYVQIVAASGAEAQMPYATSGVYRLEAEDYFGALRIYDDYVRVERIQVDNPRSPTSGSEDAGIAIEGTAVGETRIIGCSFRKSNGRNSTDDCAHINGLGLAIGHVLVAVNNVGYGHAFGIRVNPQGAGYVIIRNNTFVDAFRYNFGLTLTASSGVSYIENNLGSGAVDGGDYFHNGAGDVINNNAASDASAQGENPRDNQTFTFVDAANHDYHLAASDTGARGFGLDLSESGAFALSYDFDGDARGAVWDIGADQYVLSGAPSSDATASVEVGASGTALVRVTGTLAAAADAAATHAASAAVRGQLDAALESGSAGLVRATIAGVASTAVEAGVDSGARVVLYANGNAAAEVGSASVASAALSGVGSAAVAVGSDSTARAVVYGSTDAGVEVGVFAMGDGSTVVVPVQAAVEVGASGVIRIRASGAITAGAEVGASSAGALRLTGVGAAAAETGAAHVATARNAGAATSAVEPGSVGDMVARVNGVSTAAVESGTSGAGRYRVSGVGTVAVETGSALMGSVVVTGTVSAGVEVGAFMRTTEDAVAGIAPLVVTFQPVRATVTLTEVIARADLSV